ncbi:ImmA/IrrE family metallo-endopeptidase [uncultured Microbacterium sp.]|uniref:ImmA/IrrE family metallo-endopeptidase n=1 Tax=uncultured Microbacterium sp. TaxID=191216 RepID=UPI0025F5BF6A|nr:ImmA/IrrE family metallo-endopeptidase [uncultured Microbacterium sp.]
MRELLSLAERLEVTVQSAHLPFPYRGFYDHERRRIVYDFTLAPVERACVLAHELGHAYHGHHGRQDPGAEREADAFAAEVLIDPERLAALEAMGLCATDIAEELGVTTRLLRIFAEDHPVCWHGSMRIRLRTRPRAILAAKAYAPLEGRGAGNSGPS